MINLTDTIVIADDEIEMTAIRAQGAGGQHVNKVSSAIHLRFDIAASSLPDSCKQQLRHYQDQRITTNGIIVIKAQQFRSQEMNREDALRRLKDLVKAALATRKKRKKMRRSKSSIRKRLECKNRRSQIKALRQKVHGA